MRLQSHPIFQQNKFLQRLPSDEQRRISMLAGEAAEFLSAWSGGFSTVRPARIIPICLTVAAAAPFADVQMVIDTARVSVWIFAIDDLFDEADVSQAQLSDCARLFKAILRDQPADIWDDELAQMLMLVKKGLAKYPLYGRLGQQWEEALIGTIEAMLQENQWRLDYQQYGEKTLPDCELYLETGRKSVGGPPHMWAAILTAGDETAISHVNKLSQMVNHSSSVVRLANDLQTYERELVEGKLNSLLILRHSHQQGGLGAQASMRAARDYVQQRMGDHLRSLNVLRRVPGTSSEKSEIAVTRVAQYVAEFYQKNDFHTAMLQPIQ